MNNRKEWDESTEPCRRDRNLGMCDWIDSEIARNDRYVFSYGIINGDYMKGQKEAFEDIQKNIGTFKFIE